MRAPRVSVIIPALDEEAVIGRVVSAVPRDLVQEVIVVDNGSRDRTAAVAQSAGARVVRESVRGYGAACRAGIRAAAESEIFVFCDGDGSDDPREMPELLRPILEDRADLVIGARTYCEEGALTPQQRVGNHLVLSLVRLLYGLKLTDLGPFRAITAEVLYDLKMEHRTYGWPVEMIVKSVKKGVSNRGGADKLPKTDRTIEGGRDGRGQPASRISSAPHHPSLCLEAIRRHVMAFAVGIGLTNECNLTCPHCYRPDTVMSRLTRDDVTRLCESIPVRSINLGVGENGLHPDFHVILADLEPSWERSSTSSLGLILGFAILFRAILFFMPQVLSSDIFYRYVWDGRVQSAGINPYAFPLAADALRFLRDERIFPLINRQWAPTVYPPGAQILFAGIYRLFPDSLAGPKFIMLCFDLATIALIVRLLKRAEMDPDRVLLYAWSPLALFELAGSGHLEALMLPFVLLALLARTKGRSILAGWALGAAALIKLYPAVLFPALYQRRDIRFPLAFGLAVLLGYAPYVAGVGSKVIGFLPGYI